MALHQVSDADLAIGDGARLGLVAALVGVGEVPRLLLVGLFYDARKLQLWFCPGVAAPNFLG